MLLRSRSFAGISKARSTGIRLCTVAQHLTPNPAYKSVAARDLATVAMASQAAVPTLKLNSGYKMPLLGLGTSGLSGDKATEATNSALSLGYTVQP